MLVFAQKGRRNLETCKADGVSHISCLIFFVCLFVFLVEGDEKACEASQGFNVTWYLRYSDCYNEVFNFGVRIPWENIGNVF